MVQSRTPLAATERAMLLAGCPRTGVPMSPISPSPPSSRAEGRMLGAAGFFCGSREATSIGPRGAGRGRKLGGGGGFRCIAPLAPATGNELGIGGAGGTAAAAASLLPTLGVGAGIAAITLGLALLDAIKFPMASFG